MIPEWNYLFFFVNFSFTVGPSIEFNESYKKCATGCQFRWMLEWRAVCTEMLLFSTMITKQLCVFFVFVRAYVRPFFPWLYLYDSLFLFLSASLCEKSHNWVREFFNISICFALILFNSNWNFKHTHKQKTIIIVIIIFSRSFVSVSFY